MLVIIRKRGERIVIGDEIEISILSVGRNRVRFGITAPQHIRIHTHIKTMPPTPVEDQSNEKSD